MNHPLAVELLLVLSSCLAIGIISTVRATYTSPPYTYDSPPAPSPYYIYESPPPPPYKYEFPPSSPPYKPPRTPFKAVAIGNVNCDICKNGKHKKRLKGVTVGIFCSNGKWEESFCGTTNDKGTFKIELKGFDYAGCGGEKACVAKLISASHATPCTQPTNKHGGQKGARLQVKAKSEDGVILKAGPFTYTPISVYSKCYDHLKGPCPSPPPPPKCPPRARPGPCPPAPRPPPCRPPAPSHCPPPPPAPRCPPSPCPPPPAPPPCPTPPPYKYKCRPPTPY